MKTIYWLDWEKKIVKPNKEGLKDISWEKISKYPLTIYCDQNTWPLINLYHNKEGIITNQEKRTHQIGKATIKELRGATEEIREGLGTQAFKLLCELVPNFVKEHPATSKDFFKISNHWKFAPRFENLQEGIFTNVTKIDIKSCYANIMHDYPLPCGEPELITDPQLIEQKLKEGKEGFVSFYAHQNAVIKNNQIPFLPDKEGVIKEKIRVWHFLYTKLLKIFNHQYGKKGQLIYKNFWIFKEKKGCINPFLDYCKELKKTDEKKGKMLANSLYGYLGKNTFSGYHYHPFHLAVNHLAVLQTYYLYRQFKPKNVLAIRSDCIYVKGELPEKAKKKQSNYHVEKYQKVNFQGGENIFIYDNQELKARQNQGEGRKKLAKWFLEQGT